MVRSFNRWWNHSQGCLISSEISCTRGIGIVLSRWCLQFIEGCDSLCLASDSRYSSDGYIRCVGVNGGLCPGDTHQQCSQAPAIDGHTLCAISGRTSLPLFNLQLPYEEKVSTESH